MEQWRILSVAFRHGFYVSSRWSKLDIVFRFRFTLRQSNHEFRWSKNTSGRGKTGGTLTTTSTSEARHWNVTPVLLCMAKDWPMDVLLSWSKKQSREAATAFHQWLPKVLPGITPWHSKYDIDKGTRWFSELQTYLEGAKACIVFITSENIDSPWIYWECLLSAWLLHQ